MPFTPIVHPEINSGKESVAHAEFGFGVRGHVRALVRRDMSRRGKAMSCHRSPRHFAPNVHHKMNTEKEFPSAFAPVFTALRRGESLRRGKPWLKFPVFASWRLCVKFRVMQPDKFTLKSQEALQEAQRLAREYSHQEIDGEHLALALHRPDRKPHSRFAGTHRRAGRAAETGFGSRTGAPAQGPGRGRRLRRQRFAQGARRRAVRGDQAQGRLRQHRTSAARPAGRRRSVVEEDFHQARPQTRRGASRRSPNCAATSA